jgi:hypothetical protein
MLCRQAECCNSSAFAVSAILHLRQGWEKMASRDSLGASGTDDSASAFGLNLAADAQSLN